MQKKYIFLINVGSVEYLNVFYFSCSKVGTWRRPGTRAGNSRWNLRTWSGWWRCWCRQYTAPHTSMLPRNRLSVLKKPRYIKRIMELRNSWLLIRLSTKNSRTNWLSYYRSNRYRSKMKTAYPWLFLSEFPITSWLITSWPSRND